jgi:hypothetical protein
LTARKNLRLTQTKSLEFRLELFNAFNHAQFYGPGSVDGNITPLDLWLRGKRRPSAIDPDWVKKVSF